MWGTCYVIGKNSPYLGRLLERKEDGETCAGASCSGDGTKPERSIILLDYAGGDPQSQAGSRLAFGGEERLEYLPANLGGDAGPIVGDDDAQPTLPGAPISGREGV